MYKLYIAGKFDSFVQTLHMALKDDFHVLLCSDKLDLIQEMLGQELPKLLLLCTNGMTQEHRKIAEFVREQYPSLLVLCIGKGEELALFQDFEAAGAFECFNMDEAVSSLARIKEQIYCKTGVESPAEKEYRFRPSSSRRRILVVDDSALALRAVKGILEKDYDVTMVKNANDAIKSLHKELPDLILLDYDMPNCDGRETLKMIRENKQWTHIPVVFLTSVQDKNRIHAVLSMNPAGYILKPVDKAALFEKIDTIFSGHSSR